MYGLPTAWWHVVEMVKVGMLTDLLYCTISQAVSVLVDHAGDKITHLQICTRVNGVFQPQQHGKRVKTSQR